MPRRAVTAKELREYVRIEQDPRELPAYGIAEAAHFLYMPPSTLRYWVRDQKHPRHPNRTTSKPIIILPDEEYPLLSFVNLVEAHVLDAFRRAHRLPLQTMRKALDFLEAHLKSKYPLAEEQFETDGIDLFIHRFDQLINLSREGQSTIKGFVTSYLRRIEWDPSGLPIRLYPFTRKRKPDEQMRGRLEGELEPKLIMIDPSISFGRPVLTGTRIPTAIIAERWKAGESIDELAKDYQRGQDEIEEAIRCEHPAKAA